MKQMPVPCQLFLDSSTIDPRALFAQKNGLGEPFCDNLLAFWLVSSMYSTSARISSSLQSKHRPFAGMAFTVTAL